MFPRPTPHSDPPSGSLTSANEYETKVAGLVQLREQLDQQNLVIQTLLRLLIEKNVIQPDEFHQWIEFMDKADGRQDGKVQAQREVKTCKECGRNCRPDLVKCQFCGAPMPKSWLMFEELFENRPAATEIRPNEPPHDE